MSIIGQTLVATVIFLFPVFSSDSLVYIRPPGPLREVREIIVSYARFYGVDEQKALKIGICESNLNPRAVGDSGESRGIYQIHRPSWPEITDEMAFDPEFNVQWAIQKMAKGEYHLWHICWNKYRAANLPSSTRLIS